MDSYRQCRLCPRECGVNRLSGERGVCGETAVCRIASIQAHFGEEPCFSGSRGSGTVFFSGCSTGCFFCQNVQISREHHGAETGPDRLYEQVKALIAEGVHNLNFVTPDHFWPHIQALCLRLRADGETLPFIYNCSGYALASLIPEVARVIDIFMPDFKFADRTLAALCMNDPRYPAIALEALRAMVDAVGFLTPWDETGAQTARRGVLVRHLVLPGYVENSLSVLEILHREFGSGLPLSVMSQFRPTAACRVRGLLERPLAEAEYRRVLDKIEDLGFSRVFVQPDFGDSDFLPDFAEDEPFKGNLRYRQNEGKDDGI